MLPAGNRSSVLTGERLDALVYDMRSPKGTESDVLRPHLRIVGWRSAREPDSEQPKMQSDGYTGLCGDFDRRGRCTFAGPKGVSAIATSTDRMTRYIFTPLAAYGFNH